MSLSLIGLKEKARALKKETFALYLVARHPLTPWYVKVVAVCVVGYAFSPVDLIPDFIPVLGLLDDLILVPFGIALVLKLVPSDVLAECREQAQTRIDSGKPTNWTATFVIISIWLFLAALFSLFIWQLFYPAMNR